MKYFRPLFSLQLLLLVFLSSAYPLPAQTANVQDNPSNEDLRRQVQELTARIAVLEKTVATLQGAQAKDSSTQAAAQALSDASHALVTSAPADPVKPEVKAPFPGTFSFTFDGYYEFNFARPYDQTNTLRVYDSSHNSFSINQAAAIFELPTDVSAGRRLGARVDLMYGQVANAQEATNTLNPAHQTGYSNLFQAYGTLVLPTPKPLTVDFGKWASSLGLEGTYTKDQANYSRSLLFSMLPFYHMGFRGSYELNSKATVAAWLVNGMQQTEDFNGFKTTAVLWTLRPAKSLSWALNYCTGQEQPTSIDGNVISHPNGREHVFDTYAVWNATNKLTLSGQADYVINRLYQSSAPTHLAGGAAYVQYQTTPRTAFAVRSEYVADKQFLTGTNQALKEVTATWDYKLAQGLLTRLEYRRDWSNQLFFTTDTKGAYADHQDTATLGLIWWYGGKQGTW